MNKSGRCSQGLAIQQWVRRIPGKSAATVSKHGLSKRGNHDQVVDKCRVCSGETLATAQ